MLENNRLIAEFLGLDVSDTNGIFKKGLGVVYLTDDIFLKDWNWLMEVVNKIESNVLPTLSVEYGNHRKEFTNATFIIHISPLEVSLDIRGDFKQDNNFIVVDDCKDKITNTFEACIEFIKWYNENLIS